MQTSDNGLKDEQGPQLMGGTPTTTTCGNVCSHGSSLASQIPLGSHRVVHPRLEAVARHVTDCLASEILTSGGVSSWNPAPCVCVWFPSPELRDCVPMARSGALSKLRRKGEGRFHPEAPVFPCELWVTPGSRLASSCYSLSGAGQAEFLPVWLCVLICSL